MGRDIQTEIDIDAPPEAVWEILTNLESYADWNPLITSSSGVVGVGEKLTNRFEPPEGRAMTFTVEVTAVDPTQEFHWNGRLLGIPGLFEGRHRFELEASPDGTRLKHSEAFSGLVAPLITARVSAGHDRTGIQGTERSPEDPG